jgi:hypothetical protein
VCSSDLDLQRLYTKGPGGAWYQNGWSVAGFLALIGTWVLCYATAALINQMSFFTIGSVKIPFPGGVIWYFSVVYAFFLEWIFAKAFKD